MNIPREASALELVEFFKDPGLVSHGAIDIALDGCKVDDLAGLHTASVDLMAKIDTHLQDVMAQLEKSLNDLKKSEKRIKFQTDMLKSDLDLFNSEQTRVLAEVSSRVSPALKSDALKKLSELSLVKKRMQEVAECLAKAQELDETQVDFKLSRLIQEKKWQEADKLVQEMEEVVQVWQGTNEESARKEFAISLRKALSDASIGNNELA
ncbi:hypothetical protein B9G98_00101 [Wickerhamiella sorbophila]|uniref:Uncharacterized protein n=1 Tax=Wickerhamiella sorbophila TaxID=45607 RepID=A0A2T0FBY1_9ASCO|nr:hypothetical protein B9G98_00101 [Wickerhamiella sorbophila]PRT52481.1 hypothetical protein B9G98_00101 [Wickerhamiella sorbophila]